MAKEAFDSIASGLRDAIALAHGSLDDVLVDGETVLGALVTVWPPNQDERGYVVRSPFPEETVTRLTFMGWMCVRIPNTAYVTVHPPEPRRLSPNDVEAIADHA